MEMILQMVLLALGFLMLVKGADWFVDGASGIAERFGIPQLVVGLTIVAGSRCSRFPYRCDHEH